MDCDWDFQLKNPGLASSELTNGVARTGQRALLYATGMDEEDMKKPFVAVINSFSEMVPGHMHMRELAEQVKYGILEGGGIPRETGTIAICDGLCQGHCGTPPPLPAPACRRPPFSEGGSPRRSPTRYGASHIKKPCS